MSFMDRLWEAWSYWIKNERGGTSQGKLARVVAQASGQNTRQEDISRWLKGQGRPGYEELPGLARALGVRRDWLAFDDGPMVEHERPYVPPAPLKTPRELDGSKAKRKRGNG